MASSTTCSTLDQHDLLFFRLPRELCDLVYTYYVWERQGDYHRVVSCGRRVC
jgi:hypothetical protein